MYSLFTPTWALNNSQNDSLYLHSYMTQLNPFFLIFPSAQDHSAQHTISAQTEINRPQTFFCYCKKLLALSEPSMRTATPCKHTRWHVHTYTHTPNQQVVPGRCWVSSSEINIQLFDFSPPSQSAERKSRASERERAWKCKEREKSNNINCDHFPAVQGGSIKSNSSQQVILWGRVQRSGGNLWTVSESSRPGLLSFTVKVLFKLKHFKCPDRDVIERKMLVWTQSTIILTLTKNSHVFVTELTIWLER